MVPSELELLGEDAVAELVAGIEQEPQPDRALLGDLDTRDIAEFVMIRNRTDRSLVGFQHFYEHPGARR